MTTNVIEDVIGGAVAWRRSGAAGQPTAVFLHGLGGNRFSWEPQLQDLSEARQCCAWELPGYGDSPGLVESLPGLADVAAQSISSITTELVDVVGLSFGGMVAQHLALEHPHLVRSLALLDTSPAFGLDGTTTPESWLASRVRPLHDTRTPRERLVPIVEAMVGSDCPQDVRDSVVDSMQAIPPASLEAACRALVRHDTRDRLHEITVPTLVLVGTEDTETPPSYAAELASLTVVANVILNLDETLMKR